jgi:nucleoside phosphorylase
MPLVDFAIVTGLTEEFKVLKRIITGFEELSDNGEVWYRTRVRSADGGRIYTVVAAFQNDMGPLEAQALTANLIKRWNPAYIILVGIAGSFHNSVGLGDVLVSQQIFYYDPGKAEEGGIRYRPQGYPCSMVLIRQAEAFTLDDRQLGDWERRARASAARLAEKHSGTSAKKQQRAQAELKSHRPKIQFGTVASGSLVIADEAKKRELLALHGKIVGTEMEGAGVLHAAFYQELPTPAIVIKGVSDAADQNKDREDAKHYWRELAKENPVRLALGIIRRGSIRPLRTDEFDLDPAVGAPAQARELIPAVSAPGVAYLAFPRLITPQGPLTDVGIEIDARGRSGPLSISHLVIQYRSLNGDRRKKEIHDGTVARISEPVAPQPIEIYALVLGVPSAVRFTVTTPSDTKQTLWSP